MDTSEAEQELSELETRIERLRALYEQYFMGLEKLEPLIPRKDVDRRIWVLRREQLRNTGLRFKFQMLIQRYNTFQQYWGRILREIENGTYRRDIMRAAKRFGEKDALTVFGRRRAQRYATLAAAQQARRDGASKEAAVEELPDEYLEEEPLESVEEELVAEEYLGDDDLEDVSEAAAGAEHPADDLVDDEDGAPTLVPTPRYEVRAVIRPVGGASSSFTPEPTRVWTPESPPAPQVTPQVASRAALQVTSQMVPEAAPRAAPQSKTPGGKPPLGVSVIPMPRPSDPEVAKKRLAELAAQGRPQRGEASGVGEPAGPLELDLDVDGPGTSKKSTKPPPRRASSSKMGGVKSAATSAPEPPPSTARAQEGARVVVPRDRPQGSADPNSGLGEKRLRQIYAKYIETKRSMNESTAGLTFEKLSESLRSQAAKLREFHAVKTVDYDVVVKNGKTLLKPILK